MYCLCETKTYLWGVSQTAQAISATSPRERMAIDILGSFPKTVSDNEYFMFINDYFID